MSIYTRYGGSKVRFLSARLMPVWIKIADGQRIWSYVEPGPGEAGEADKPTLVWHTTARYDDPRKGHGNFEQMSGYRPASDYTADRGWPEIHDMCIMLNGIDADLERRLFQAAEDRAKLGAKSGNAARPGGQL